jgi:hypothetical protein
MIDYTEEMLEKCVCCSGCNKMRYLGENEKTCGNCRERSKTNQKMARETVTMCKSDGCKFKKSDENDYCMKHQICILIDEVALRNKRLCFNYIRGCREELELDHKYNRCENCLIKDREKDKLRRNKAKEINEPINKIISQDVIGCVAEKTCTVCCKVLPMEMFQGVKGLITLTCSTCRENNKKNDMNRDKEHRNSLARVAERKPERIAVKNAWKEENYEKVAETWQKSRNNRLVEVGEEEFLKRNAEDAQRWRDNNPEKVAENNENKKKNLNLQYNVYTRSARDKNLTFELSFDDYKTIVGQSCCYCGIIQDHGFNGIDRINQQNGYVVDNCVSCCQMCNYIKNTVTATVFVKRAEHIAVYGGHLEEGTLYHDVFSDHIQIKYLDYKKRAQKKQIGFEISEEQFDTMTSKSCYTCGKTPSISHCNGIDRFDSGTGYVVDNCRSCCADCNYMKKDYNYDEWIAKLVQITHFQREYRRVNIKDIVSGDCAMLTKSDKKSKKEMTEAAKLRKQEQRKRLKEKYGDEEYRKMHAKQIAAQRKKKNEPVLQNDNTV